MKDKKPIIDSPEYRKNIGKKLKLHRIMRNFSVSDVAYMLGTSDKTISNTESGKTTNIDYYVEYAKAVQYPMETLLDFKISMIPLYPLPNERLEATKLTAKIRQYIIEGNFLSDGRTVAQIRAELAKLKQIDTNAVTSSHVAGVMRNLSNDNLVKVGGNDGRKNLYVKAD
ncbi:hypothetical protein CBW16_11595 [Flavobacteriaceae bacterium JJC]|nr:hypothetical protein CBW16_11595 [Flavobacteriaceae bacterium JJC]